MVYNLTMKVVNIHEAKARLSEFLDLVESGERVLICRRNQPVAELRAVVGARTQPRPLGGTLIELPPAFFDPLPAEVTESFYAEQVSREPHVAEAPYAPKRPRAGRGVKR